MDRGRAGLWQKKPFNRPRSNRFVRRIPGRDKPLAQIGNGRLGRHGDDHMQATGGAFGTPRTIQFAIFAQIGKRSTGSQKRRQPHFERDKMARVERARETARHSQKTDDQQKRKCAEARAGLALTVRHYP
ncbi:MAG: hypothetical protein GW886_00305 [Rhodobacterales bacterium]|nr:hypothetical protein [Rhodobacterales bacterium]